MFEMLYAKSLYICLPFFFPSFNTKQPFSLLVLCLRTEEQHLLETKEREQQQGVPTKRTEADIENHLMFLPITVTSTLSVALHKTRGKHPYRREVDKSFHFK